MNMENFDKNIWLMHRKLFHRYLKYVKYFRQVTDKLPEYGIPASHYRRDQSEK